MFSLLQEIFQINRPLVFFVYGLVFFLLGLAILLQSRQHSRLILARSLHWLAIFGVSHGLYEWARLLGGVLTITNGAEYGTALQLCVPWEKSYDQN